MAYCKFDSGDVWMHSIPGAGIQCHWCKIASKKLVVSQCVTYKPYQLHLKHTDVKKTLCNMPRYRQMKQKAHLVGLMLIREPVFTSYRSALDHLTLHHNKGQRVPNFARLFLESDIATGEPIEQKRSRRFVLPKLAREIPNKRTRKMMRQEKFK